MKTATSVIDSDIDVKVLKYDYNFVSEMRELLSFEIIGFKLTAFVFCLFRWNLVL